MYLKLKIILILVFFFWEKKMGVDKSIEQISDNIITEEGDWTFFSYWIFVHCDLDMYDI